MSSNHWMSARHIRESATMWIDPPFKHSWRPQFNVWSLLGSFMIGAMLCTRISFIIDRFWPRSHDQNVDQSFQKRINAYITNLHFPLIWFKCLCIKISHVMQWNVFHAYVFIWICIVVIENTALLLEWEKVDEQVARNYIDIDSFRAENCECVH